MNYCDTFLQFKFPQKHLLQIWWLGSRFRSGTLMIQRAAPTLGFICLGAFGLSFFLQGKIDLQNQRGSSVSESEWKLKKAHESMTKEFSNFDYKLVPIPKPNEAQRRGQKK